MGWNPHRSRHVGAAESSLIAHRYFDRVTTRVSGFATLEPVNDVKRNVLAALLPSEATRASDDDPLCHLSRVPSAFQALSKSTCVVSHSRVQSCLGIQSIRDIFRPASRTSDILLISQKGNTLVRSATFRAVPAGCENQHSCNALQTAASLRLDACVVSRSRVRICPVTQTSDILLSRRNGWASLGRCQLSAQSQHSCNAVPLISSKFKPRLAASLRSRSLV